MPHLKLTVLSLRYSSWSIRAWLTLTHAGAIFETETVELSHMLKQGDSDSLSDRRELGSVHGLFPVLRIDGAPVHESYAICEYVAETFPEAGLWPDDSVHRAQARAICCEMVSGFLNMRGEMSSHLFGRVPGFSPSPATEVEVARIFEIWSECLARSGGPFLFGRFGVADAMYFPVLGRLRTYGVSVPDSLSSYTRAIDDVPAVRRLIKVARNEPHIPVYDDYLRRLGGDPDAALTG